MSCCYFECFKTHVQLANTQQVASEYAYQFQMILKILSDRNYHLHHLQIVVSSHGRKVTPFKDVCIAM